MFYPLCFIFCSFLLLFLRVFWIQRKALTLLRKGNLPVRRLPSVWYFIIKSFLPTNQDLDSRIKWFLISTFTNRMYSKERIFAASISGSYYVDIFKPEYVEAILTSYVVLDKGWMYGFLHPWLGNGLITSSREKWKRKRKLLTPAFHFKILENFHKVMNKHSFVLIEKLKNKSEEPWLNIIHLMSLCTLDIIAETAMGVEIRAQENEESEYVKTIGKIEQLIYMRIMSPWLWPNIIYNISPTGREFTKALNIIHNFIRQVISEKKNEIMENHDDIRNIDEENDENIYMQGKKKNALLTLLLQHYFNEGDIIEEEIKEEVNTFMFAGHDTTAMGTSWALYNIGLYPHIQQKLHEEIQCIFGEDKDRSITLADLREMKYLECVLKESLRLYPSVPAIMRNNTEDFKLNDKMTIPAGTQIVIQIYSLHHDPELYPNPEVFDPDRFLPENSSGRHPFAFLPFSAGPRNCIGQRFALIEEKIIISNILRQFQIKSLDPRDKVMEYGDIILRPTNKLRIKFTRKL